VDEGALGWAGKVLRVDLTTGRVRMDATRDFADEMIGGRGISQLVLWRELDPPVDPLGPGNKLILGIGPLRATLAPASGRLCVDFLSPLTGGVGSSNVGGHLGPELKYAGLDQVIIEGQATAPVYLLISNGQAEIRDADHLWRKTTRETERVIRHPLVIQG
jgi:aldehyde:ferredoxin oxidoreductase